MKQQNQLPKSLKLAKSLIRPPPAVLVVDDDADAREPLADILERQGYRVLQAANGRQALELLGGSAAAAQLIRLDLDMPVMNGWEFLKRFARDGLLHPRIVVITGREQKPIAGAAAVLRKPLEISCLLELMQQLVGH